MVNKDDEQWGHYLAFRDYLREHPQLRSEYDAVKRILAKRFPADREAYTNGKVSFVRELLRLAGREKRHGTG
jgi:GrpB-like predicted nucleotidyltransferase (UPF0157 family)